VKKVSRQKKPKSDESPDSSQQSDSDFEENESDSEQDSPMQDNPITFAPKDANGTHVISIDSLFRQYQLVGTSLSKRLVHHSSLRVLTLDTSMINDAFVIDLSKVLQNNRFLQILSLRDNQLTDNCAEALADLLLNNKSIHTMHVDHNRFTDEGGFLIAETLLNRIVSEKPSLHTLTLQMNNLSDGSALLFLQAMNRHSSLCVDLACNKISFQLFSKLSSVLESNKEAQLRSSVQRYSKEKENLLAVRAEFEAVDEERQLHESELVQLTSDLEQLENGKANYRLHQEQITREIDLKANQLRDELLTLNNAVINQQSEFVTFNQNSDAELISLKQSVEKEQRLAQFTKSQIQLVLERKIETDEYYYKQEAELQPTLDSERNDYDFQKQCCQDQIAELEQFFKWLKQKQKSFQSENEIGKRLSTPSNRQRNRSNNRTNLDVLTNFSNKKISSRPQTASGSNTRKKEATLSPSQTTRKLRTKMANQTRAVSASNISNKSRPMSATQIYAKRSNLKQSSTNGSTNGQLSPGSSKRFMRKENPKAIKRPISSKIEAKLQESKIMDDQKTILSIDRSSPIRILVENSN